jgi:hypothetical protein
LVPLVSWKTLELVSLDTLVALVSLVSLETWVMSYLIARQSTNP